MAYLSAAIRRNFDILHRSSVLLNPDLPLSLVLTGQALRDYELRDYESSVFDGDDDADF